MSMRGIFNPVSDMRRKIFTEIAKLAYKDNEEWNEVETLANKLVSETEISSLQNQTLQKEIMENRIRLGIGLPLQEDLQTSSFAEDVQKATVCEKVYQAPLINIIKSACNACPEKKVLVTNTCQGCIAHPCKEVCPKDAIEIVDGKSYIHQEKCIKCGRCIDVCPYQAIQKLERPCAVHCGVDAIHSDENGKAQIDYEKCVSCGMCMVNCPFGAIVDKSQIYQCIQAIKSSQKVIAAVAPAFIGQFGNNVTPDKVIGALKQLGFDDVVEVAIGADLCTVEEAEDFLSKVPQQQPFMVTSCCPAWSVMTKKMFPDFKPYLSKALTPMVFTGRLIKKHNPDVKVVFIGPCVAKKLEASRTSVRSDIDFVLTFEEVMAMFVAKNIDLPQVEAEDTFVQGTTNGRIFAVSGGVANAVKECILKEHPQQEVNIEAAMGLKNCRTLLQMAKAGKKQGYLLEGMACPGGCVAGAGTIQPITKSSALVKKYSSEANEKLALQSPYVNELHDLSNRN